MSGASVLALALLLAPQAASGGAATDNAFVEVAAAPATVYVGQPLRVTVRFGFTADFLHDHVVPLFAQPLDVEAQLDLPWLAKLEGARTRDGEAYAGGFERLRCAVNDGLATVGHLPRQRDDPRNFEVFELVRSYLPERAGTVTIPAPTLRFAWASQFRDDLLRGHVAVDRTLAVVNGKQLDVAVVALPDAGRPAEFCGAVGSLRLRAEVGARSPVDGTFRLTLTFTGDGNLEAFDTPNFPELDRFRRLGTLEEKSAGLRTLRCDLKERDATTTQVPSLSFTFFDTKEPAGFRTIQTEPLTVPPPPDPGAQTTVRAPAPAGPTDGAAVPSSGSTLTTVFIVGALALAIATCVGVVHHRRTARRRDGDAHLADTRARTAAAAFAVRSDTPDADLADAFADYLAARLATTAAAVIAPELAARLEARGVAPDLAKRTAARLHALVAARYGAGAAAPTQEVPMLVRELEAAFTAADADRSAAPPRR